MKHIFNVSYAPIVTTFPPSYSDLELYFHGHVRRVMFNDIEILFKLNSGRAAINNLLKTSFLSST